MSTGVRFLDNDKIPELLNRLGQKYKVFAPVAISDTIILFKEYGEGDQAVLDKQATQPPKDIILPQTDCLLKYAYQKDPENLAKTNVAVQETIDAPPAVIFGARPCDARGFTITDSVFLEGQKKDPYYKARRDATTIVTVLCTDPAPTCFCTSVGGSPADTAGSDLALTPVSGGYIAEAITEKGEAILNDEAFVDAGNRIDEAKKVQESATVEDLFDLEGIEGKLLELFSTDFWNKVSSQCISCGTCTYVCPTCYCFNITDETAGLEGERIRTWDSCMFYHYTLETSGHNPRPTKAERYRNRIGHKFSYHPTNYSRIFGCCGCGRCIQSCPVSLDIRQVLQEAKTYE